MDFEGWEGPRLAFVLSNYFRVWGHWSDASGTDAIADVPAQADGLVGRSVAQNLAGRCLQRRTKQQRPPSDEHLGCEACNTTARLHGVEGIFARACEQNPLIDMGRF